MSRVFSSRLLLIGSLLFVIVVVTFGGFPRNAFAAGPIHVFRVAHKSVPAAPVDDLLTLWTVQPLIPSQGPSRLRSGVPRANVLDDLKYQLGNADEGTRPASDLVDQPAALAYLFVLLFMASGLAYLANQDRKIAARREESLRELEEQAAVLREQGLEEQAAVLEREVLAYRSPKPAKPAKNNLKPKIVPAWFTAAKAAYFGKPEEAESVVADAPNAGKGTPNQSVSIAQAQSEARGNRMRSGREEARKRARKGKRGGSPRASSAASALPSSDVVRRQLPLATGLDMECLSVRGSSSSASRAPPVVFIHGTFHGAWCWEKHWMQRFADAGLDCHAISLRGTSGSPTAQRSVKIDEHVADLSSFLSETLDASARPPTLVGHSFGSATVLKYLEAGGRASGAALLCGVPPSGNGKMTVRFARRDLGHAWSILKGFAFKSATTSAADARRLFFDEGTSEAMVEELLPRLQADSQVGLDLRHFNANLPSRAAGPDGRAAWLDARKDAPPLPTLVLGASRDFVVDREAVLETAAFLGAEAEYMDLPHDLMVCQGWEQPADRVIQWARGL